MKNRSLMPRAFGIGLALLGIATLPQGLESAQDSASSRLANEVWGVELQLPTYELWRDHPLANRPNFVLAANASAGNCELNASMFAISLPAERTAHECRKGYMGNPEKLSDQPNVEIYDHKVSPITYTHYDNVLSPNTQASAGLRQNQLYAYWTRGDTCFELHISSMNCDEFADHVLPILGTVVIDKDSQATIETVAVSSQTGRDPGDWEVHFAIASKYLHGVEPSMPQRARRFYLSALTLSNDIPPRSLWLIEEGIGLTWLMEDDGEKALTHLTSALEIARQSQDADTMLASTLYNVSCAYAIADQVALACEHLDELLLSQSIEDRKSTLKDIKKDDQLKALRKSDCYKSLRSRKR